MSDVLIVDDCAATALTTKWHLEQRGAKVVAAQSLPAGLKILSKAPGDYRVAIVAGDLTLTKCSDAAKKLQDVAPQVLCFAGTSLIHPVPVLPAFRGTHRALTVTAAVLSSLLPDPFCVCPHSQLKVVCMGEDKSGSYASSTSKPVGEDEADRLVAEYNLEQTEPKRQRVTPYKRELLFGRCILVIDREGMLKNAIPTVRRLSLNRAASHPLRAPEPDEHSISPLAPGLSPRAPELSAPDPKHPCTDAWFLRTHRLCRCCSSPSPAHL